MLLPFLQGIHDFFCLLGSIRSFGLTLTLFIIHHKLIFLTTFSLIQRLSSISAFLNSLARFQALFAIPLVNLFPRHLHVCQVQILKAGMTIVASYTISLLHFEVNFLSKSIFSLFLINYKLCICNLLL